MAEKKAAKTSKPPAKKASAATAKRFTAEERSAMKERAKELKSGADGEQDLLAKIAEMAPADRTLAERLHAIVMAVAPGLVPKTWYGMPAYAMNGETICFFQPALKFKTRYATFGFSDKAKLDDGDLWPSAFALQKLTPAVESKIAALVKRAVG